MEHKPVVVDIIHSGSPVVNGGIVYRDGQDVIALAVDLESKRCRVTSFGFMDGVPNVGISADEYSIYLDEAKPRDEDTHIAFPEYAGWSIWCADISKYTLAVCLTRDAR